MCCKQGCGAFGRKKYVVWTSNEFPSGQLALKVKIKVKVKQSRYRPGEAQRVPGS
jgi:hypothetical protein